MGCESKRIKLLTLSGNVMSWNALNAIDLIVAPGALLSQIHSRFANKRNGDGTLTSDAAQNKQSW